MEKVKNVKFMNLIVMILIILVISALVIGNIIKEKKHDKRIEQYHSQLQTENSIDKGE